MKRLVVSGAVVLGTIAGCSSAPPPPEATAETVSAIQGGTTDTTHDFAVGIEIDLGGGEGAVCSGALLAPNLVATARHCADKIADQQVNCATSTFGAAYSPSQYLVTNSPVLQQGAAIYAVAKIVTPTGANQDDICGDDIALLILTKNIQLAQYVEPVLNPPMTDHSVWATTVTAIGYGIDSPTDTNGASAGTRRIRENIGLVCIPNDTTFTDCYSNPQAKSVIAATEFESGDGTCEGDSGSSAFDQTQFNAGKWVSFGVLSRGGVSSDGTTCVGSIYSRFDAWSQLIIDTANEAAQMGGYAPPVWASEDGGAVSASDAGNDDGGSKSNGSACGADAECTSANCVSTGNTGFVCASPCGTGGSCSSGTTCESGFCFPSASSSGKKGGCSVALADADPTHPVPWRAAALTLGLVGLALARRRR
jgi:MYXO-CTERM domain-containing protein